MTVTKRQGKILNRIVEEYIDLAEPISSKLLEKKYDFGICPASIRIEMQKLTDSGFISQPHTSAGRVPTDMGYRFFVDSLFKEAASKRRASPLGRGISEFKNTLKIKEILKEEDTLKWTSQLTKFLAEESSNFAVLHLISRDLLLKEGWEEILKEPEFEEKDFLLEFTRFLENFEENIDNWEINSGIKIYIGRENPFSKAKDFSIMSTKCHLPDKEEAIISLLGPKRMAYDKNISLIDSLIKLLERL